MPQPSIRINVHVLRRIVDEGQQQLTQGLLPNLSTLMPLNGATIASTVCERTATIRTEGELRTIVRCSRPTLRVLSHKPQPSRSPSSAPDVIVTKPSRTTTCTGRRHSCRPMISIQFPGKCSRVSFPCRNPQTIRFSLLGRTERENVQRGDPQGFQLLCFRNIHR